METVSGKTQRPGDANWAMPVSTLQVSRVPTGSLNLNVEGRQVVGPLQGFGCLWQKTFRLRIPDSDLTPAEVMQVWKKNFPHFQPVQNRFFPVAAIEPGQVVLINASMTGMPLSTGVMVLYEDEESFTLMTPQGHPESGWVTFSTYIEDDCLLCQIQTISRANDPLYELGFRLFASRTQDHIWTHVLTALATYLYAQKATDHTKALPLRKDRSPAQPIQIEATKTCLDPHVQWSEAKNIRVNAALCTLFYALWTPVRWLRGRNRMRR